MRDPAVRLDVAGAVNEIAVFLTLRKRWLEPTQYDWSDVNKRAWVAFHLVGRPMRWYLPALRCTVELRPVGPNLSADVPDDIRGWLDEPKQLLPGRAAQTGKLAPRDVAIVGALKIALRRGFDLTRNNPDQENESACSLVRQALERVGVELSERQIQRIGTKHSLSV
jgi:hypothetical protein